MKKAMQNNYFKSSMLFLLFISRMQLAENCIEEDFNGTYGGRICERYEKNSDSTTKEYDDEVLNLLYPTGGEAFCTDEIIPVSWTYNPDSITQVLVHASLDSGKTWREVFDTGSINVRSVTPDTLIWNPLEDHFGALLLASINAGVEIFDVLIRVSSYDGANYFDKSDFFSLSKPSGILLSAEHRDSKMNYAINLQRIHLEFEPSKYNRHLCIYTVSGKLVNRKIVPGNVLKHQISIVDVACGCYILKVMYDGHYISLIHFFVY